MSKRRALVGVISAMGAAALVGPATAGALTLNTGDILVVDYDAFASTDGGVLKIDPRTGKQTVVSSNDQAVNQGSSEFFRDPWALTMTPDGRLLVTETTLGGVASDRGVISIDPATGKQTVLSSNSQAINSTSDYFAFPTGIVRLPSGELAIADGSAFTGNVGGVIGVDPRTGKQSVISNNEQAVNAGTTDFYTSPYGLGTDGRGALYVADAAAFGANKGGIIGVDPATGKQSELSSNDQAVNASSQLFNDPSDVKFRKGTLFVSDGSSGNPGNAAVIAVNPATGAQHLVAGNDQPVNLANPLFEDNYGIAVEPGGRVLVTNESGLATGDTGGVIAVDRLTGKGTLLSSNDQPVNSGTSEFFDYPDGILVVPPKCAGQYATIVGTPGKDTLKGTKFADVIAGLGANDRISGLAGKDRLCGGKGRDRIRGGAGRDKIRGGPGRDRVRQ